MSKVTDWLKKFGEEVLKGLKFAVSVAPLAEVALPGAAGTIGKVTSDLEQLANVIMSAEVMGQALSLPGAQKLTAAAPQVAQVILGSALLAGKKVADPAKFQAAVNGIASNMADLLSSLKADVATVNKAA